jgi:trimeric autotransporter adhesin
MNQSCRLKRRTPVFLVALTWFVLSPTSQALLPPPPPDGGYPNNNTAEGTGALFSVTTGTNDTAVGAGALQFDTSGLDNTAIGSFALRNNTVGSDNTACGNKTLQNNTGSSNTALGSLALQQNTMGYDNTATGFEALESNTTGFQNTANGPEALQANMTGHDNTASGFQALFNNVSGDFNTATGVNALLNNTGNNNTAEGADALQNNTTGFQNVASGAVALFSNMSGHDNTASGFQALLNNTTGSHNIALGARAGSNLTTGSNNIDIGADGSGNEANTIRVGKTGTQQRTFIAGISGKIVANGLGVFINPSGQLGTIQSSARFKDNVKPMNKASEAILALKPVSFRYTEDLDPDKIPQFGLIAEEVEKVDPDLVVRDEDGKVSSVRYEAVNAMLLNEFLKEHCKNEEQEATIAQLKSTDAKQGATIARQQKQIEALIAGLEKVGAQLATASPSDGGLELSKPAPRTVLNSQ